MKLLFSTFLVLSFVVIVSAQNTTNKQLLGNWQYTNQYGTSTLFFQSGNQLVLDGVPASYTASATIIQVFTDGQYWNYPYRLSGNVLSVTFPGGSVVNYKKNNSKTSSNTSIKGKVYLLNGTFCSYSGSSSSYSSYSSTTKVYFDGKGSFQYKSETSFSSNDGSYSNDGNDGVSTGRYDIKGNSIVLYFPDGTTGYADVYFKQDNGSISEIKYDGTIYAKNLCD
ncbi:MAG: hypothetical protein DRJ10_13455 [Bacteroidetes bacterium]|nr:MAG: hypothetical protein DRJ10_13455 [Bacteroidota bacterium]